MLCWTGDSDQSFKKFNPNKFRFNPCKVTYDPCEVPLVGH